MWRRIADFPPHGAQVAALATFDGGFVAVGETEATTDCEERVHDGRIWTSREGTSWTEADIDLARISMSDVVVAAGTIYAFGHEGADGCEPNRQVVARSADGLIWRVDPIVPRGDSPQSDYAAVGDSLIAVGQAYDDDGQFLGSVWTSDDGVEWAIQPDSPESSFELSGLAVQGDTVVLFNYAMQPIWFSADRGVSWQPADYEPLYSAYPLYTAASGDRFAAVGYACCATRNDAVGIAIWSPDGRQWHEGQPFGTRRKADGIVGLPNGFFTIGRQSWLSDDGADWVIGPDIPGYETDTDYNVPAGAANSASALITNRNVAWVASVADLDATFYSDTAQLGERPTVGSSYDFNAFTHCGWPAIHFDLRAWVPDPPIDDGGNPPNGIRESDHGTLTFVSEDELRYDAQGGRVVNLVPSDEATLSGPCA